MTAPTATADIRRLDHGTTRSRIQDILETFAGDWYTIGQLTMAITNVSDTSETAARRAIARLIAAAPDWIESDCVAGERRLRAPDRRYLWT